MAIAPSVRDFITEHGVEFDIVRHRYTSSSMNTASAAHVSGDRLAKSVVLEDEEGYLLAIVPASHRLDLGQLGKTLGRRLGLATEQETGTLFDDCVLGAIPPVGAAYGVETVVDESLTGQPDIYFEAGDHEQLVHVTGEQFAKLMGESRQASFSHHV